MLERDTGTKREENHNLQRVLSQGNKTIDKDKMGR